jgi:hypothetical protein
VSNNGTATGHTATQVGVWNPGAGFQSAIGGIVSGQTAISDDGRFIAGTAAASDGRAEMARYDRTSGAWTTFGGTGGFSGTTRSAAWSISPDGSSVGGFGYGAPTGSGTFTGVRPAVYKDGVGMADYSFAPTATGTNRVQAISNNGVAAGIARFPASTSVPVGVVWNAGPGSQQGLPYTSGQLGEASDLSGDGRFVAGHGSAITRDTATPAASRPYIFDAATNSVTLISSIAGLNGNNAVTGIGSIDGLMSGITADGSTSVGFFRGRNTAGTALVDKVWGYIWTQSGGAVPFDDFAASLGAPDSATRYYVPTAISNDGSVIAGYTYARSGALSITSFMITNVPSPGGVSVFALPMLLACRRRRVS